MSREVIPEKEKDSPIRKMSLNLLQNHPFPVQRIGGNGNSNSNGYIRNTDVGCYMLEEQMELI